MRVRGSVGWTLSAGYRVLSGSAERDARGEPTLLYRAEHVHWNRQDGELRDASFCIYYTDVEAFAITCFATFLAHGLSVTWTGDVAHAIQLIPNDDEAPVARIERLLNSRAALVRQAAIQALGMRALAGAS